MMGFSAVPWMLEHQRMAGGRCREPYCVRYCCTLDVRGDDSRGVYTRDESAPPNAAWNFPWDARVRCGNLGPCPRPHLKKVDNKGERYTKEPTKRKI
jgi:hypothetical protein